MARTLTLQQTERLEALSEQRDYCESLLHEEAELQNEHYTDRWSCTISAHTPASCMFVVHNSNTVGLHQSIRACGSNCGMRTQKSYASMWLCMYHVLQRSCWRLHNQRSLIAG